MDSNPHRLEQVAEQRADRLAYAAIVFFAVLSWIISSSSEQIEARAAGIRIDALEPWVIHFASDIAVLLVVPIIPFLLSRVRFAREEAARTVLILCVGLVAYIIAQVLLLAGVRSVLWPIFLDGYYETSVGEPLVWLYESREIVYTFLLNLAAFYLFRSLERLRLDAAGRTQQAEDHQRLVLNSGGRTLIFRPSEIWWAKAASNYVEIQTETGTHLVRISLSELETLIEKIETSHVRCHRSFLVQVSHISKITPRGNGGAELELTSGKVLPIGRSYRAIVERLVKGD
nr:LytTR family DNA-binding domain-containing protein [Hyphomonas sp. Mor2]